MSSRIQALISYAAVLAILGRAIAYPNYWYAYYDAYGLSQPTCSGQPSTALASSPHGSPRADSAITFTFTDTASKATDTLCPGVKYTVAVAFGSSRLALLTANASAVAFTSPAATAGCSNRVDLGASSTRSRSFTAAFTVPCSVAGSAVSFMVTSASGNKAWLQGSRTMTVAGSGTAASAGGTACASALTACGITPAATSTPSTPSTSGTASSPTTTDSGSSSSPTTSTPSSTATPTASSTTTSTTSTSTSSTTSSSSSSPPPPTTTTSETPQTSSSGTDDGSQSEDAGGDDSDDVSGSSGSSSSSSGSSPTASSSSRGTATTTATTTSTASSNSTGCTPSPLGYQCTAQAGKLTLHWSLNTASAPGGNGCTPANTTVKQAADVAKYGTLHMAVQSAVSGYVSVGFNSNPNQMYPADIVLGWASSGGGSSPYINSFHASGNDLGGGDAYPSSGSWAYDKGVSHTASSGLTTVCFSRLLADSRAAASPDLLAALGLQGAAAAAAGGRRRLSQAATAGAPVGLIWAVSPAQALVQHSSANVGGLFLDLQSGSAGDAGAAEKKAWINAHGGLMAVAWALLLPLGTFMPAHRWVFGEAQVLGKAAWFVGHLACQWTGVALFIAGFVVALVKLGDGGGGDVSEAHGGIGIAVAAAAGTQVVFAFIRPAPGAPRRPLWNLLHHNLGRVTVLLAWANVYIGIYVYHTGVFAASYTQWIAPIAATMGLLVLADLALRIYESATGRKDAAATKVAPLSDNVGLQGAPLDGKAAAGDVGSA